VARTVADAMGKSMGQTIVIDNRLGAGGTIAAALVAKSDADGYTVLVHSSGHALNASLYPNLAYDTVKDLTGVTTLAAIPNVLVVNPSKGWKALQRHARRHDQCDWRLQRLVFCTLGLGLAIDQRRQVAGLVGQHQDACLYLAPGAHQH
jgi:hypothetical protein